MYTYIFNLQRIDRGIDRYVMEMVISPASRCYKSTYMPAASDEEIGYTSHSERSSTERKEEKGHVYPF